jgi:hypothetical protein
MRVRATIGRPGEGCPAEAASVASGLAKAAANGLAIEAGIADDRKFRPVLPGRQSGHGETCGRRLTGDAARAGKRCPTARPEGAVERELFGTRSLTTEYPANGSFSVSTEHTQCF